ncbi:fungal-specific transcription factor domain-containing protein [Myxozyma melibiosi]|uniref:Fungal-specific transcription factor domain-containing protein n=1 Tax=Myxozyma melibiosi TaxID=54550 RepID=A0ABR1EZ12_9ASCO
MAGRIRFVVDEAMAQYDPSRMSSLAGAGGDGDEDDLNVVHRAKRVSRACQSCKQKKIRCSGTQPCTVCASRQIECIYKEREPPSGSPSSERSSSQGTKRKLDSRAKQSDSVSSPRPDNSVLIRQPYFRWLGPTSVAPPVDGKFRLISVNLTTGSAVAGSSGDSAMSRTVDDKEGGERPFVIDQYEFTRPPNLDEGMFSSSVASEDASSTVEYQTNYQTLRTLSTQTASSSVELARPTKEALDVFYSRLSSFLPFLRREEMDDRIRNGVAGECMLYAIAALVELLQPGTIAATVDGVAAGGEDLSELYAERAKVLLIPHLAIPSVETVYALLLIAYHEFAQDRDSGLWSWSGLAIRMSYDLGLHKSASEAVFGADREQVEQRRRVFWGVFCLDRLISCGTGRVCTILLEQVEYEVGDVVTGNEILGPDGSRLSDPFPFLCRLMTILGKVSDTLNSLTAKRGGGSQTSHTSQTRTGTETQNVLVGLQTEVSEFYASLPPDLVFDVRNFQAFAQTAHAQCFLLLHVWNHAIILAVYHPDLVYPRGALDISGWLTDPNADLARTSAISIADMIAFAELVAPEALLSNPFVSQPMLMAGCASLSLWHSLMVDVEGDSGEIKGSSANTLQHSFATCKDGLRRLQKRWKGVSWLCSMLDSLENMEHDVDLSRVSGSRVRMRDEGFVKRASIDEATRMWLAGEQSERVNMGVAIAGTTTESGGFVGSSGVAATATSTATAMATAMTGVSVTSGNTGGLLFPGMNEQQQQSTMMGDMNELWGAEDPLRSLLMGDMSLDEFLSR